MKRTVICLLLMSLGQWSLMAQETPQSPNEGEELSSAPADPAAPVESQEAIPPTPSPSLPPVTPPASETPKIPSEPKTGKGTSPKAQRSPSKGLGRLADLKLSPEQTAAMIEARKASNPELEKSLREQVKLAKEELANAMVDNSPSEEVRKKFLALQKKYNELQTIKFEKSLKIREILNLEQRKKFQEIRSKSNNVDP